MAFMLHDARSGAEAELRVAAPPRAVARAEPGAGERAAELAALLRRALAHHGYDAREEGVPDAAVSEAPPAAGLWVRPGELRGAPPASERRARGFADADWRLYLARAPYRAALDFSWEGLAAARAERERLAGLARALSGTAAEPNARGLAGYRQRFRERLGRDLDAAGALDTLWDGLKPGALSPGSRAGLLRLAEPVLALGLPIGDA